MHKTQPIGGCTADRSRRADQRVRHPLVRRTPSAVRDAGRLRQHRRGQRLPENAAAAGAGGVVMVSNRDRRAKRRRRPEENRLSGHSRRHQARSLRNTRPHRRRRHGRGASRARHQTRARCRDQDVACGPCRRSGASAPVRNRSQGREPAFASQHRQRLRHRDHRRPAVHRVGAPRWARTFASV